MTEHNNWMYGYLRLKKENDALRLRVEELEGSIDEMLYEESMGIIARNIAYLSKD